MRFSLLPPPVTAAGVLAEGRDLRTLRILGDRTDVVSYFPGRPPKGKYVLSFALRGRDLPERRRFYDWFGYHHARGHAGFELVPSGDRGPDVALVDARLFSVYDAGLRETSGPRRVKNVEQYIDEVLSWPVIREFTDLESLIPDGLYMLSQVRQCLSEDQGILLKRYYQSHKTQKGFLPVITELTSYVFPTMVGREIARGLSGELHLRERRGPKKIPYTRDDLLSTKVALREGFHTPITRFLYPNLRF